jgi:hypothetical protein
MFGRIAIVLFAMLLLATTIAGNLHAQGRGGFRGGPGRAGNMSAPPSVSRPAFVFNPHPVRPQFFGGSRFGGLRHQRPLVIGQPFIGGFSPFFWDAPLYPQSVYPAYAEPAYAAPSVSQNEIDLANQVQRLSQEIEQLRQEQALALSRQPQPPPPPPAPGPPPIPTTLVFRDGRRMLIENYAIVGQTIWVLDEKTSAKISMGELDLAATEKENRSKGVRFSLPQR